MTWQVDLMTETEALHYTPPVEDEGLGALRTERGNLPLESIRLQARITGLAARLDLAQGFHNPYDQPLEATFVFPLPDRAAVTGLSMEADGRTVQGVLAERGNAREQYERAVQAGRRASIAEEERPGVFTMRVGNIMPAERVQVRLTLAAQLPYEDGEATFRFPLVVAPRYIPGAPLPGGPVGTGTAPDTDAVPDASRITPPVLLPGFPNPVDLSIEVELDRAGLPIRGVRSSLHVVTVDEGPAAGTEDRLRVRMAPGQRADRDFVLRFGLGSETAVSTSLAVLPDEDAAAGTFALTVLPPTGASTARPRDVVLVLDRSGSMRGWKMVAARRAAARIVDTLGGADRFAVLAFDHVIETPPGLPPPASGLAEATDRHRYRAVEHLARMDARGGTEMLAPLTRAAQLLAGREAGRERVLVLVTDGQIGNEDQILGRLAAQLDGVQVYTVGVDTAANEAFLRRLAHLGQGRYELVESEDRLDEVMTHIHRRIGTPMVTELDVVPDGLRVSPGTLAPDPSPDLYPGAPVVVTGRFEGPAGGGVTVRGHTADGGQWRTSVPAGASDNPALAAVWARWRIRDLEDRYVTLPYPGAVPAGTAPPEDLEREIIALSLRHAVLSRFTAFVAVDTRVVNEGGQVHRVTQPVDLPQGWDLPGPAEAASYLAGPTMAGASAPEGLAFAAGPAPVGGGPSPAAPVSGLALPPAAGVPGRGHRIRARDRAEAAPILDGASGAGRDIRAVAAEELRRLAEIAAAPQADRPRLLAELAARLAVQIARLTEAGADAAALSRLQQLADELAGPDAGGAGDTGGAELEQRLALARAVLAELAGTAPALTRRRAFWKR
jgi:Ca-activated chloride channel homolog